jgi:O-antigen biosynthesis protein WbqV
VNRTSLVKPLKIVLRASIRITAVILGYLLAAGYSPGAQSLIDAIDAAGAYALVFAGLGFVLDVAFRADRSFWRYASIADVIPIVRTSTLLVGLFLVAAFFLERASALPRAALILVWILDIGLTLAMLVARRLIHDRKAGGFWTLGLPAIDVRPPLVVIGHSDAADSFLRSANRSLADFRPVAVVTPTVAQGPREIRGVRLVSGLERANELIEALVIRGPTPAVVFADETLTPADFGLDWVGRLRAKGVKLFRLPSLSEVRGVHDEQQMREFRIEELLPRPPIRLDENELRALISGRRVLVTGAGGSIGSEICRQVASLGCAHLSMLDNSEFALFQIEQEIRRRWPTLSVREYLHDIREGDLVRSVFVADSPDIVFHAAALKHVPLMERHPCESVLTNVVGTWNVATAAAAAKVGHMVFISTDKAVDPPNVMGATKRLAEAVVRAQQRQNSSTRFSAVRFGNVLGSAGSVVPTFRAQIERGGPVTLTHPEIERYFMTIPEAVQLVLHATAASAREPDAPLGVFVLDMGKPVKIKDLAEQLIGLYGKIPGVDIEIEITGLRPGEKLFEELVDSSETAEMCADQVMRVTDRVRGVDIDYHRIAKLEKMARSGDNASVRALLFEILAEVRSVEASGMKASVVPLRGGSA